MKGPSTPQNPHQTTLLNFSLSQALPCCSTESTSLSRMRLTNRRQMCRPCHYIRVHLPRGCPSVQEDCFGILPPATHGFPCDNSFGFPHSEAWPHRPEELPPLSLVVTEVPQLPCLYPEREGALKAHEFHAHNNFSFKSLSIHLSTKLSGRSTVTAIPSMSNHLALFAPRN